MKQIKSLSLLFNLRSLTYGHRNFDKPENKSKITNNKHKKINPIKLELIQFTQRSLVSYGVLFRAGPQTKVSYGKQ
jgi:hypothetical protein